MTGGLSDGGRVHDGIAAAAVDLLLRTHAAGYLLIDTEFVIHAIRGKPPAFISAPSVGACLLEIFPELIGSEAALHALVDQNGERFDLPMINRDGVAGQTHYVNLTVVCAPPLKTQEQEALLVLWEDVTQSGRARQKIMQQRNELTLLRNELARQNDRLVSANAELRHANELKSRFVGVAAHELRSPLTSIMGYAELLQEKAFGTLDPTRQRFVDQIEHGGLRLLSLLNNLLDVTRIEAGNLELVLEPVTIAPIIRAAIEELRPQLDQKGLTIHYRIDAAQEALIALCDRERLGQVLTNLIENAIKYTPEAGEISVHSGRAATPGYLEISVQDTGVGIPEADRKDLFTSFFRAGNAQLTAASGAGLGLSIARSLVEQHGGEIRCTSEVNHGSIFTFTLPTATPHA